MTQLVARLDSQLAADLDELLAAGFVESKSDAIRKGLRTLVQQYKRQMIDKQIIDGYTKQPQIASEMQWPDERTLHMIEQESW